MYKRQRLDTALAEIESGAFETMQFPLSALSSEKDLDLVRLCKEKNMGVIGMKGLAGGLLTSAAPSMAYLRRFDNLVPIWGIQRESELQEVLELEKVDDVEGLLHGDMVYYRAVLDGGHESFFLVHRLLVIQ